jgi:hypothetical protein
MTQVSEIFDGLITNLKVDNSETIAARRDEMTKTLNKEFRGSESSTSNRLMVGSYGRWTAIRGISDLDLLYILPASTRAEYDKEGGPSKVLTRTRLAIQSRYPKTSVTVDRLVVVVQFTNFMFEVQPVFENDDQSFSYPDTYSDSWKITKPREEIGAISTDDTLADGNLRRLCKLARAWKNRHGVGMGGLLIDTLVYNFLRQYPDNRLATSAAYDQMVRDFFFYLSQEKTTNSTQLQAAVSASESRRSSNEMPKEPTNCVSRPLMPRDKKTRIKSGVPFLETQCPPSVPSENHSPPARSVTRRSSLKIGSLLMSAIACPLTALSPRMVFDRYRSGALPPPSESCRQRNSWPSGLWIPMCQNRSTSVGKYSTAGR